MPWRHKYNNVMITGWASSHGSWPTLEIQAQVVPLCLVNISAAIPTFAINTLEVLRLSFLRKAGNCSILMYIIFFYFSFIASWVGLSPLYCGDFWPIVPARDDRRGWLWCNWWNENWQGKPKYSEKTYPSATLSAAAVGSQRLTAWAMARPILMYIYVYAYIYIKILQFLAFLRKQKKTSRRGRYTINSRRFGKNNKDGYKIRLKETGFIWNKSTYLPTTLAAWAHRAEEGLT
jgi:hypothetical protein